MCNAEQSAVCKLGLNGSLDFGVRLNIDIRGCLVLKVDVATESKSILSDKNNERTMTMILLSLTNALHNASNWRSPALKLDPSSLTGASRSKRVAKLVRPPSFSPAATSTIIGSMSVSPWPPRGNNHARWSAEINSASVRVPTGSLDKISAVGNETQRWRYVHVLSHSPFEQQCILRNHS